MTRKMRLFSGIVFALLMWPLWLGAQAPAAEFGVVLDIDGPIGPATWDYFGRAMEQARKDGARVVILRMDTPGGLDSSMRAIIQEILSSPVPVVTYVAPNGARAASAGTYILYASHVAAMAPATNLGAATPVQIAPAGLPSPDQEPRRPGPEGEQDKPRPPADDDAMTRKVINDAVAYIRGLAKLRGRNADWAEKAVREAASLESDQALAEGVIDLIAQDLDDLLQKLDGRTVKVLGKEQVLATAGLSLRYVQPDWRSRLLAVITDPNVAYILMLIGIYGLIFEFANPGTIVPGVVGAICLLLALYAFQVLPVNYAGLGLIILGVALMVGEAFAPSFGALGIGGVLAFVIGSIILLDTDAPGFGISLPLIGAFALFSAALFTLVLGLVLRARRRPVVSGSEELVGTLAEALDDFEQEGAVRVHSELWRARSTTPVRKGQKVLITGMDGLCLLVKPQSREGG